MPAEPGQIRVPWESAAETIRDRIRALADPDRGRRPVVVGITGPVGSGKSTLARRLGGVCISTDRYLPDYQRLPHRERDEPRHAALDLLAAHLASLGRREAVDVPIWCFHAHRRAGSERVEAGPLVICEGLFALSPEIRPQIHLGVFVEAPADVRWARWERLEQSGQRGWGVEVARAHFAAVADPTFARFAPEYRAASHVIVVNDRDAGADPGTSDREQA